MDSEQISCSLLLISSLTKYSYSKIHSPIALVVQRIEHRIADPAVVGSIPAERAALYNNKMKDFEPSSLADPGRDPVGFNLTRLAIINGRSINLDIPWETMETRMVMTGPFGRQFGQVKVINHLSEYEKHMLHVKACFSVWKALREMGAEDLANTTLKRKQDSVPQESQIR